MIPAAKPVHILMADDDPDDCDATRKALARHKLAHDFATVANGEELLEYLRHEGPYVDAPRPGLILLDLNMPRKDGREALAEIKADPALRGIPVVVLSTSREHDEIARTYALGANSYIAKPVDFEGLVHAIGTLKQYWFQLVELPSDQVN